MGEPIVGGILGDAITRNGDGATLRKHHYAAIGLELVARGAAIVSAAARHAIALPVLGVVLTGLSLVRLWNTQACCNQHTRQGDNDKPHEALSAQPASITTQRSKCSSNPHSDCETGNLALAGARATNGPQALRFALAKRSRRSLRPGGRRGAGLGCAITKV